MSVCVTIILLKNENNPVFKSKLHVDIEKNNILVLEIVRVGQFSPLNCKIAI